LVAIVSSSLFAQSLLLEEEKALQAAGDFAQVSVVRIETFGGREIVEDSAVAAGPSSGTVVAADGWIITSLFQFRGDPPSITVVLPNGERKAAKLVARDYARSLALLKIDAGEKLVPAIVSPRASWEIGQWTIALGKTFDLVSASRSIGILSATDRIFGRAIQTDCKVSPHNYGGPLIDIYGRVMGILAPIDPGIATEGEVQQWYDSGIGFAVPLDDILARLPKLQSGDDIQIGKAGIRPKINDDFRGPVELAGVSPGTPVAKAGLRTGDRILKIGNIDVHRPNHMRHALGVIDAGNRISILYERDGRQSTTEIVLVKELPVYRTPFLGLQIVEKKNDTGLRIERVLDESPADKAGLKPGMILQSLASEKLVKPDDLDRALAFVDFREPLEVHIVQEGDSKAANRSIDVEVWPSVLLDEALADPLKDQTPSDKETKPKNPIGIVPITMGDVPNQVFAFVPPNYSDEKPQGLLVVMPEPGKIDRKAWIDRWEVFCREHNWILTVVGAADPEAWQREELDVVKRVIQQLRNDYTIDPRRLVISGIGSGGAPAMILGLQNRSMFRGLWLVECNVPRGLNLPQAEPLESPSILLQGDKPIYEKFVERAREIGYRAHLIEDKIDLGVKLIGEKSQKDVESFLRSLAWF
jgi:serine protease Do